MTARRTSYGRSDAASITSITTSESSRVAVLIGTAPLQGPNLLLGLRATNDVGAGATFTIRVYSASSGGLELASWDADLSAAADVWDSTQFTQPIPVKRTDTIYVTAESNAGSGHGVSVTIDTLVADVI